MSGMLVNTPSFYPVVMKVNAESRETQMAYATIITYGILFDKRLFT